MTTTREQRRQHIQTMRTNFGFEDANPDVDDLVWQERYVEGKASLEDLLNYAQSFAKVRRQREEAERFARANVGLEGLTPSTEAEALSRKYIDGQISIEEAVEKLRDWYGLNPEKTSQS